LAAGALVTVLLLGRSLREWLVLWRGGPLQQQIAGLVLIELVIVGLNASSGPLVRALVVGAGDVGLGHLLGVEPGVGAWLLTSAASIMRGIDTMVGLAIFLGLLQSLWETVIGRPSHPAPTGG
jgi:hypothetical protein